MIIIILGEQTMKVDKGSEVQVFYRNGKVMFHNGVKQLILNPEEVMCITITDKK